MYLGKASQVFVSGYNKQNVIDVSKKYCIENGYNIWRNIYREFRFFKWKWEYKIDLYKPIDFKIEWKTKE